MAAKIFLDTNVIVYAFDGTDARKNSKAKDLLDQLFASSECRISTQVIQEFCNVAFRKMVPPLSSEEVREFINALPEKQIENVDVKTISKALYIKEKYQLSFWDSLIISAASLAGIEIVYSEDMKDGLEIDGLKIINPFS